jgi:hypothetical protein
MHRALVDTQEVAKFISLPEDLKKSETLELLITPFYPNKKAELKKQLAVIFKKAKQTKIPGDVNIDDLMNEMNDAVL